MIAKNRVLIIASFLLLSLGLQAQITTNNNITPVQAVEDILLGAGINAFNITYNGSAADANNQQGNVVEFDENNTGFPLAEGVLMSTDGPTLTDPDLSTLTGGSYTNGAIIEFDFVPTGDTLSFNYIFASTEYPNFVCSNYNDVFGFFLSGPGINGPFSNNAENIATIPGGNIPVAINTVNSGTAGSSGTPSTCAAADPNWQSNSVYFTTTNNTIFSNSTGVMSTFGGSTVVLPATADLSCQDTFHIKLAVSNDFDTGLDSGVFLEAESFTSGAVEISENGVNTTNALDSLLVEGCSELFIDFIRPVGVDPNDTITTDITYSGGATVNDDYDELVPGDSITFLPGEDTLTFVLDPIADGVDEPIEEVTISTVTITDCGDTVYSDLTYYIADEPPGYVTTSNDTTLYCLTDSAFLYTEPENGFEPYAYDWPNGSTDTSAWINGLDQGLNEVIVTVTDDCGFERTDTSFVTMDQTLQVDTVMMDSADCGIPNGLVNGQGSGFTGTPDYNWSGPGDTSTVNYGASVWNNRPSGWYYFSIEDDVCKVEDSIFVEQTPPPNADIVANPNQGSAPLNVTLVNNSDAATTYEWDFGNGETETVNDLSSQNVTYDEPGLYTVNLTVSDGACTNQASAEVLVILVNPLTYDLPNVFTPNGDGTNDEFILNMVNEEDFEMVILNRWGNVVFETTNADEGWNGEKNNDGKACSDGTYFYKFEAEDENGKIVKEHGFVQLVRDTE